MQSRRCQRYSMVTLGALAFMALGMINVAAASTIEKWLIMPGPVVESHAAVEDACESCHDPLSDQPQFELCVACHTEVGEDVNRMRGFHGRLPSPGRFECASCHSEHEGRDLQIVHLDEAAFDHALTDYPLVGGHSSAPCGDCHVEGQLHRDTSSMCFDCHRDDDPHKRQLGDACESCHTVNNWQDTGFDHSTSRFPLTGAHLETDCVGCHQGTNFTDAGTQCIDCHQKDDKHKGRNGTQCMDCHSTASWTDLTFNHLAVTGFALNGGHGGVACADCHRAKDFLDLGNSTCNSCHQSDDVHQGRNGTDCASCHNSDDWRASSFNHDARTDFRLPAGHEDLDCSSCHVGSIHDPAPRDCGGCHVEDDPHKGQLGTRCEGCHVAEHWTKKLWFDHDLTSFPLLGEHADVSCDSCHETAAFRDAGDSCVSCHVDDDPHKGGLGNSCGDCHNPSTWQAWIFDHEEQSNFALTGAHVSLTCAECHADSRSDDAKISGGCRSCHRRDDPHAGRFGDNCENCHSTSTFTRIESM